MTRMPLKLFMDHHVPRAISMGLRLRHVDVLTAYEDRAHELADPALLDRATNLGRVLFTMDDDLPAEAAKRQRAGIAFGGVIYAHPCDVSIGKCVLDLQLIAAAGTEADVAGRVVYLPL